jgi:hypothetical protein
MKKLVPLVPKLVPMVPKMRVKMVSRVKTENGENAEMTGCLRFLRG